MGPPPPGHTASVPQGLLDRSDLVGYGLGLTTPRVIGRLRAIAVPVVVDLSVNVRFLILWPPLVSALIFNRGGKDA